MKGVDKKMNMKNYCIDCVIANMEREKQEELKNELLNNFKNVKDTNIYLADINKAYQTLKKANTNNYDRMKTAIKHVNWDYQINNKSNSTL